MTDSSFFAIVKRKLNLYIAATERESAAPLGILLAQETQRALDEWKKGRGESRSEFISQRLAPFLGKNGLSKIFGNHINSCLQEEKHLEGIIRSLQGLSDQQINLVGSFYQIRQGFTQNASQADITRQEIKKFNQEHIDQIPEQGFLPGLFRIISNNYPDPSSRSF